MKKAISYLLIRVEDNGTPDAFIVGQTEQNFVDLDTLCIYLSSNQNLPNGIDIEVSPVSQRFVTL